MTSNAYTALQINWEFFQGDSVSQLIGLGSEEEPVDITGWQFRMKLKTAFNATEAVIDLTTENEGIVIEDAENGLLRFVMTSTQTSEIDIPYRSFNTKRGEIPYATLFYDLEAVRNGTDVKKYAVGVFKFFAEVTN